MDPRLRGDDSEFEARSILADAFRLQASIGAARRLQPAGVDVFCAGRPGLSEHPRTSRDSPS
jgi:hypothetical protein